MPIQGSIPKNARSSSNGDFKVNASINPYHFDNNQILQDSVTPEAPQPTPQVTELPRFKVSYYDKSIALQRHRRFTTLEEALSFITHRAQNTGLYNNFLLEIKE